MKVTLLFFSWFYIPLHSGALIPVCFGLFHVQLEILFRAWCNGFVLWAGHSRDVRVSQAPCAGSQGCLWRGEHGGVCSSGSNGIITWNWAGFVGIVEAIFDPEHANCLTMVFFPPLGLREQRYSVKTCCRYCNMLNMGVFLMFCCDVWAFRGLWSTSCGEKILHFSRMEPWMSLTFQHIKSQGYILSRKTQLLLFLSPITWLGTVKEEPFLLLMRWTGLINPWATGADDLPVCLRRMKKPWLGTAGFCPHCFLLNRSTGL